MSSPTTGSDGPEQLLTGYTGRIATALAVAWLAIVFGRGAIPPLLPAIVEELRITPAAAGVALTVMWGLYALLQFPGGRLSDQLSRTVVIALGIGVLIAGFVVVLSASGYPVFLLGVALLGVGGGLYFSPARAFIADLFVRRRGQAFGLQTAASMVGGVLAATVAAAVLAFATWRVAFLPSIAILAVALALLLRWSRESYAVSRIQLDLGPTIARLVRNPRVPILVVGFSLFGFASQGFLGFLPTMLQAAKGFSPSLASGSFALVFVVGIVAGPSAGRLGDWLPRTHVVVGAPILGGIGLLVLLCADSVGGALVGIGLTSVGLWAYFPSIHAYLGDILADESLGGDFGLIKTAYTGLGSLGPTYVGIVAGQTSYPLAFAGLVGCLGLSAVVLFVATRG